jgi:hypothetical protein
LIGYALRVPVGNVSLTLNGALTARPASCNGVGSGGASGPTFPLLLSPANRAVASQGGQTVQVIDSADDYEVLGIPANQATTVALVQLLDMSPFMLRLTFESSAQVEIPVAGNGLWVQEFPADDRVTELAVKGQGRISWLAGGQIV